MANAASHRYNSNVKFVLSPLSHSGLQVPSSSPPLPPPTTATTTTIATTTVIPEHTCMHIFLFTHTRAAHSFFFCFSPPFSSHLSSLVYHPPHHPPSLLPTDTIVNLYSHLPLLHTFLSCIYPYPVHVRRLPSSVLLPPLHIPLLSTPPREITPFLSSSVTFLHLSFFWKEGQSQEC
jgi:hypothetical protein